MTFSPWTDLNLWLNWKFSSESKKSSPKPVLFFVVTQQHQDLHVALVSRTYLLLLLMAMTGLRGSLIRCFCYAQSYFSSFLWTADLGSLSICDDTPTTPVAPVPVTGLGPSSDPRPAVSFLKVTELHNTSPLKTSHTDAGKCPTMLFGINNELTCYSFLLYSRIEPLQFLCVCCFFLILVELKEKKPIRPDCYRHFIPRYKTSSLDQVHSNLQNDRLFSLRELFAAPSNDFCDLGCCGSPAWRRGFKAESSDWL